MVRRNIIYAGVDRSLAMANKARSFGLRVAVAMAQQLPFADGGFDAVVVTYPGAWILDPETWTEIERVLHPGGQIIVLLGGTVTRGRGGSMRSLLTRAAYGTNRPASIEFSPPIADGSMISGTFVMLEDAWGTVYRWEGFKAES